MRKKMSIRFDHRTKETFKKDIYTGTRMEKYFFNKWLEVCDSRDDILIDDPRNNGVDNTGEFIENGKNTAGADYKVDIKYQDLDLQNHPLEVKWCPTAGKLTLKTNDLKAYIREGASILFIYNSVSCGTNLRMPRGGNNLEKHFDLIESKQKQFRWGIMWHDSVKEFLEYSQENDLVKSIPYMGHKLGIVLPSKEYSRWFKEEDWCNGS